MEPRIVLLKYFPLIEGLAFEELALNLVQR
jgi:hypothetical protein